MLLDADTIVAIATAPGRGGIGIVRLSGPQALAIATPRFRFRHPPAAGFARFAHLLDEHGQTLDEAVVTLFATPHSYTGEDVVEMAMHGAPVLLEHLVRACIAAGARLAEPGEFTQRAFLNGRLDLTQAEAVADLINAQTLGQARLAAAQLGGSISQAVAPIKQQLISLIAQLEAGVDFAEDDLDLLPQAAIAARLATLEADISAIHRTYRYGRLLHDGFRLAIVGRPNVGKSSLFNRLLERERAIVSPIPGTTRDPVSERFAISGIPVEIIDTAGLRDDPDGLHAEIEAEGMRRTRIALAEADLVLVVADCTSSPGHYATEFLHLLDGQPHLVVWNKSDLGKCAPGRDAAEPRLLVSAKTGDGIDSLRDAIVRLLTQDAAPGEGPMVTSLRQHQSIARALEAVQRAQAAANEATPHEFLLLDLYAALEAMDSLTGATAPDSILNLIFSTFCIGK